MASESQGPDGADGPRYEILDTIASGEFATVYRARDRELGREVAVKQIHPQYLADPRQLARYWQEAQLLASLQHPNILTIYDVVRPRGWLILELMRGSLKQAAEGDPMDLDLLRVVLANCLTAPALPARQRRDPRRHQAQQHPRRPAEPHQARRLRPGPAGQQRGRQPPEGHDEVHGPRAALRSSARSVRPATSIRWGSRPTS